MPSIFHEAAKFSRFSAFSALEKLCVEEREEREYVGRRVFQVLAGTEVHNSTRCYLSPRRGLSHQRCISDQLTTLFQFPLFV